jgi:cytochrome P450
VTVWETSANRDEDAFENPFRFDVGRDRNNHISFGLGAHFSLGANLARSKNPCDVRGASQSLRSLRARRGPLAWMNNNRLVGLTELPVNAFPR